MTNDLIAKAAIDRRLAEIVTPVIEDLGFELVRIRLMGGKTSTLQIMAERPEGGISVDECGEISTAVSAILDVEDPIASEYRLEVSSPGMDRPLFALDQFAQATGELVKLKLRMNYEGRRNFKGRLVGVENDDVVVQVDDHEYLFPLTDIEKANVVPSFE